MNSGQLSFSLTAATSSFICFGDGGGHGEILASGFTVADNEPRNTDDALLVRWIVTAPRSAGSITVFPGRTTKASII